MLCCSTSPMLLYLVDLEWMFKTFYFWQYCKVDETLSRWLSMDRTMYTIFMLMSRVAHNYCAGAHVDCSDTLGDSKWLLREFLLLAVLWWSNCSVALLLCLVSWWSMPENVSLLKWWWYLHFTTWINGIHVENWTLKG